MRILRGRAEAQLVRFVLPMLWHRRQAALHRNASALNVIRVQWRAVLQRTPPHRYSPLPNHIHAGDPDRSVAHSEIGRPCSRSLPPLYGDEGLKISIVSAMRRRRQRTSSRHERSIERQHAGSHWSSHAPSCSVRSLEINNPVFLMAEMRRPFTTQHRIACGNDVTQEAIDVDQADVVRDLNTVQIRRRDYDVPIASRCRVSR